MTNIYEKIIDVLKRIFSMNKELKIYAIVITIFSTLLFVAIDPLNLLEQQADVSIIATGEKNINSKNSEVWILDFSKPFYNMLLSNDWEKRESKIVSYKNQPAIIKWNGIINRNHFIRFECHQYSGIVEIIVNGEHKKYDLYNDTSKVLTVKPYELTNFISMSVRHKVRTVLMVLVSGSLFYLICVCCFFIFFKREGLSEPENNFLRNTSYLGRLDHLRFFAASLVVMYHFFHEYISTDFITRNPFVALVSQGHTGVGLFMILSGFIFGIIGYDKNINYKGFLYNRIIRIFPLYVFALLIVFSSHRTTFSSAEVLFSFLPFINPAKLTSLPLFGHLWTIGVEFQFYLVFPFINSFIRKNGYKYIFLFLLLTIFLKGFYYINLGSARDISYWTILGRIDQFLIGILFAHIYKRNNNFFVNPLNMLCSTAIVLGVICFFSIKGGYFGTDHSKLWILWPVVEGTMWAYFSISYISLSIKIPNCIDTILSKLGSMSFSMYVMHYTVIPLILAKVGVINLTGNQLSNVLIAGMFIVVPSIALISLLTYSTIEKPFFSFKTKYIV